MTIDLDLGHMPPPPKKKDFRIGAVGAGFIMRDVHLVAYRDAGYNVVAIASAHPESSRAVADRHAIPGVYDTYQQLLADDSIEVLDIAVPPHVQPEVIRAALRHAGHISGILAQKPLAVTYKEARELVRQCEEAGITLAVNQNMRYDQSIRALKSVLDRDYLGEPGPRHHRDAGHPALDALVPPVRTADAADHEHPSPGFASAIYSAIRNRSMQAPAQTRERSSSTATASCCTILEYANGLRAAAWDDVWAGPAREGAASDIYIKWRVEGTEGMAQGTIGWPGYPNATPSTIQFTTAREPGVWFSPQWKEVWFPDAFRGTMGMLLAGRSRRHRTCRQRPRPSADPGARGGLLSFARRAPAGANRRDYRGGR